MSRRRLLGAGLTLFGGTVLAGCAAGTGGGPRTTLQHWYHQYGEEGTHEAVLRYAREYTSRNPGVAINVTWVPGDYPAKLQSALLAGGPDVFEINQPTIDMIQAGQLLALNDIYTPDIARDLSPRILGQHVVDGKIYGVKVVVDVSLLYYRKSMLSEAGIAPPSTVDELIAAAKALTRGRVKGLFIGNDNGVDALYHMLPWSAGADLVADKKVAFDNPRTVAAYGKLRELSASNSLLLGFTTDYQDPSAFTQGLCAMQWTGLWAMPGIKKKLGDDFDVLPWPRMDTPGGTPVVLLGGWSAMVNAKSRHVDEAKKYVQWLWLNNQADQRDFNLSYGFHVPPRQSLAASAEPLREGPARHAVQLLDQFGRATPPEWDETMKSYLEDSLGRIIKENADIAEEVTAVANRCQEELREAQG